MGGKEENKTFFKVGAGNKKITCVLSIIKYIKRYSDGNTFMYMHVCVHVKHTMEIGIITIEVEALRCPR